MSDAAPPAFSVREAIPDDAAAMIAHGRRLCEEPGVCITMDRDEFTLTEADERKFVADLGAADNSACLVAETTEGRLVGLLIAQGGKRRATRHEAVIGISVAADWRGRGVGTALMSRCVEWARSSEVITRLELRVFTRNAAAIRVYERAGFVTEGVCRRAVFREGRYEDSQVMGLLL